MKIISSAYYDQGIRRINEDSILYEEMVINGKTALLAMVADGVGGLEDGHVASGYAVESMMKLFVMDIKSRILEGTGFRKIKKCILYETRQIYDALKRYADIKGIKLGTTFSLLFIYKKRYLVIHLGDSSIKSLRGARCKNLTPLHQNPDGSLNRCLGSITFQSPYIRSGMVFKNTGYLLSTDGFTNLMGNDIESLKPKEIHNEDQIEKRLLAIGNRVSKRGETDNKSAIYIKVG